MKRITKLLAMGMAMALTFGMTVSASEGSESPKVPITARGEGGVSVTAYTNSKWDVEFGRAQIAATGTELKMGNKLVSAGFVSDAHDVTCQVLEVFDVASRPINGKLIWEGGNPNGRYVSYYDEIKDYGKTWGFALFRIDDCKMYNLTQETHDVLLSSGAVQKVVDYYWTGMEPDSGHAYAMVMWTLNWMDVDASGNIQVDTGVQKGWEEAPFTDHAAKAHAYLWPKSDTNPDGRNLGNMLAEKYCGNPYGFQGVVGTTKMILTDSSYVDFNLPHLDADQKYLVVLHPYDEANGTQNNWPSYNIDSPYTVVLEENIHKAIDGCWYGTTINKGTWLATVFVVAKDPKNVPADPTPVTSAPTTTVGGANVAGAGVAGATTAGGVVSPKTGEMLPVATILAAVCLVGAAVCAKKARKDA